jgi:hypothetical protein
MGSGIGYIGGNYKNDVPYLAAKKAGKALFKKLENPKYAKHKNRKSIKFVIRMKDRHSPGKTYSYQVIREKLKKPILIKVKNTEYYVRYNYVIKACDLSKKQKKILLGGMNFEDKPYETPNDTDETPNDPDDLDDTDETPNDPDDTDDQDISTSSVSSDDVYVPDDTDDVEKSGGKKKKKKGGNECVQKNDDVYVPDDIEKSGGKKKKGGNECVQKNDDVYVPDDIEKSGGKKKKKKGGNECVQKNIVGGKKKKGGNNKFYEGFDPDENKYSSIEGGKKKGTKK